MSPRPEFYGIRFPLGVVHLCRCCVAVLTCEGRLGGDPTKPNVCAEDVSEFWPLPDAVAAVLKASCANCEALRQYEEKRALLAEPQARPGEVRT